MNVSPSPTHPPAGFAEVGYEHEWLLDSGRSDVWEWLCDPDTFVDSQIWPWEVEFLANDDGPEEPTCGCGSMPMFAHGRSDPGCG